jgi:MFS transporter, DHA1 family, tetracycline resistance protein
LTVGDEERSAITFQRTKGKTRKKHEKALKSGVLRRSKKNTNIMDILDAPQEPELKPRPAGLIFIFITLLIDVMGLGIIIPVIPKLIVELTGRDLSHAALIGGWMMLLYALMQFIFAPVLGGLSDQYGRRPVLLGSLFGFGVDFLLLAFAPTIGWLFAGRVLAGILGSSFTTAGAYIADISTPENRAQNFGMIGAAFGLGFIFGPLLGGVLGQYGTRIPFYAAACLSLLNWLYGYFVLPESLSKENRRPFDIKRANPVGTLLQLRNYPIIISMMPSLILLYLAMYAVQGGWTYYTIEKFGWSEAMIGYSLAFVGIITSIVQAGLIRIIIPKIGPKRGIYLGLLSQVVGLVCFAFAWKSWMMFAFCIPYCLGGIAGPSIQSILSTQVKADTQGELQGGLTSLMSAVSIVGPLMMSAIFSYFTAGGPSAPYYFPGAAMMTGAILTLLSAAWAYRILK